MYASFKIVREFNVHTDLNAVVAHSTEYICSTHEEANQRLDLMSRFEHLYVWLVWPLQHQLSSSIICCSEADVARIATMYMRIYTCRYGCHSEWN